MKKVGFGGGCHWCTEAVFQALEGVSKVRQGFIRSDPPNDQLSEAVEIVFDPSKISLKSLMSVHLATHASTSAHKMRGKYRSAVYAFDEEHRCDAEAALAEISKETEAEFVTNILMHRGFEESDERFQNYYERRPDKPFCKTYIDPKLAKVRQDFPALMKQEMEPQCPDLD